MDSSTNPAAVICSASQTKLLKTSDAAHKTEAFIPFQRQPSRTQSETLLTASYWSHALTQRKDEIRTFRKNMIRYYSMCNCSI
jgi:hypothetical protein